jgi:pentatricopeptide repeat protein
METIDIVSYTTVIKGLCNDGRLHDGLALVSKMTANDVVPNVRTANTLLRGCILLGQVSQALNVLYKMEKRWGISPDASSWEYVVALLCRGMQIDAANTMVGRLKQKSGNDAAVCNNPALYLCICRCNAILGRWKPAVKAGNKALVFLREEEERDKAAASTDSVDKNNKAESPTNRRTAGGKRGWGSQATSHSRNESLKLFKRRGKVHDKLRANAQRKAFDS